MKVNTNAVTAKDTPEQVPMKQASKQVRKQAAKQAAKAPSGKLRAGKAQQGNSLEPQQERSRESLRKLMKAAAEVLGQHGVDGATIPRIAAHAGLTPGAIYRRFSDKDALLESVIMDIFERQDKSMRNGLTQEVAGRIPLPVFAEQIVNSLLVSYRANGSLLRAMRQFAHSRVGTEFWKKIVRLEKRTYIRLVDLLLASAQAGEIQHPEPRMAVSLGMTMVVSTLQEIVLNTPDPSYWKDLLPIKDQALRRELTQALLSYLGVNRSR